MSHWALHWALFTWLLLGVSPIRAVENPPLIRREFRGMWIATLNNIDWPSKPGLSAAQQELELKQLFDLAKQLRLNAVILQVRPAADALYESKLEPWSEFLSGRMGVTPGWDPLARAVVLAHQRGLELHAWFNPFRARHESNFSPIATTHITRKRPDLTRQSGRKLWLDPGESDVREHVQKVILDVVTRYDIDGVHLDDYFYPYPEKGVGDFDDRRSWARYQQTRGALNRADWRRRNVNEFVQTLGQKIHQAKPLVKFGISPFGIWRPGNPVDVKGMDAFEVLHADARKWWAEGWLDYCSPQLYWPTTAREQAFGSLLHWWAQQNSLSRHLWPGVATARIGEDRDAAEIGNQIRTVRYTSGVGGVLFWNASSLKNDLGGIQNMISRQWFTDVALVPPCPWLAAEPPEVPILEVSSNMPARTLEAMCQAVWKSDQDSRRTRWLLLHLRFGNRWTSEVLPSVAETKRFPISAKVRLPDALVLTAIGQSGQASDSKVWVRPQAR